jgi:CRISPR-associated protein Csb1
MTQATWSELATRWLKEDGPAAIVVREWLTPVEGADAVIFPPTFARPQEAGKGDPQYNIDELSDRTKVALIDSVGSQANRMEPLFKEGDYAALVPQVEVKAGERVVNLLDAGHRAADAIIRYSPLANDLRAAFLDLRDKGDARKLAAIAPTSLVFGAWDSRDTQAKLPRLLASTIRAYGVEPLTRSAQYNPPLDYVDLGLIENADEKKNLDAASELGFRHAPAAGKLGGIIVRGEIRREVTLSLVGLRTLGPSGKDGEALRRYILGLALVALTYDRPHNLRQGCLLVRDSEKRPSWKEVHHDGRREEVEHDHKTALAFAKDAAEIFAKEVSVGLGPEKKRSVPFDVKAANAAIGEKAKAKAEKSSSPSPPKGRSTVPGGEKTKAKAKKSG